VSKPGNASVVLTKPSAGGASQGVPISRSRRFIAPAAWNTGAAVPLVISVDTQDFMEAGLDADPSTPVDWGGGHWTGYENTAGAEGDSGGVDCSFAPYAGTGATPTALPCREAAAVAPSGGSGGGGSAGLLLPLAAWALARRRRAR
jgi:hypothetical protein